MREKCLVSLLAKARQNARSSIASIEFAKNPINEVVDSHIEKTSYCKSGFFSILLGGFC